MLPRAMNSPSADGLKRRQAIRGLKERPNMSNRMAPTGPRAAHRCSTPPLRLVAWPYGVFHNGQAPRRSARWQVTPPTRHQDLSASMPRASASRGRRHPGPLSDTHPPPRRLVTPAAQTPHCTSTPHRVLETPFLTNYVSGPPKEWRAGASLETTTPKDLL